MIATYGELNGDIMVDSGNSEVQVHDPSISML